MSKKRVAFKHFDQLNENEIEKKRHFSTKKKKKGHDSNA